MAPFSAHATRPARPKLRARRAGFTLVEVLVALLILSVIAAMGWQGVASMGRAREIGQAASERTLRLQTLVAQWEQDLLAVYDSPSLPGLRFDGAALRLLRRSDAGVQVVVWAVRDGRWQRWAGPATTRSGELAQSLAASQQLQGQEPGQLLLTEGVTGWQLYCWRDQGWSNCQSSDDVAEGSPVRPTTPPAGTPPSAGTPPPTGGDGTAAPAPTVAAPRARLPLGVRLQIDLAEGRLLRDVALAPQLQEQR